MTCFSWQRTDLESGSYDHLFGAKSLMLLGHSSGLMYLKKVSARMSGWRLRTSQDAVEGVRWILPADLGCLGPCQCTSVLCCWSALVGRLSVLDRTFWGFPLLFALLHLFPPLRLFVTHLSQDDDCMSSIFAISQIG